MYFLCSYAGVLLAILLTGKLLTTLFAVGVFGLYIPLLYFLWFAMQAVFLETRVGSFYEPQFGILRCSSPWAFCLFRPMDDAAAGLTGAVPPIADFCQLLAMAALFTAASLLLYRIRRTEAAGSALAFKRIEGAVKLLLTVPTAVLAALLAYELLESVLWELIFMALFGALGCMIMEFIFRGDIRQVLHRKKHILLTVLLAAALFFPLRFDLAGYNTYLPAREEVAAMAVKDFHFQMHYPEVSEEYRQQNTQERKMLDYLETDRVDVLYPLAAEGVKNAENITGEGPLVPINLKYRLTNGKEVYRFYYVNQDVFYRCMEELMADPDYRETYFPLLTWSAEDMDTWRVEAELYPKEKRPADEAEIPENLDGAENADGAENPDEAENADGAEDANEAENAGETEIPEDSDEDYGVEFSGIETASDDSGKQVVIEVDKSERERLLAVYQKELKDASWKELWEAGNWMYVILDQVNWQMEMYPLPDSFRGTQQLLQEIYEADGAIGRAG